jgi:hypothetical protein
MKICLWDDCSAETSNPKFCSLSCGTKYQRKYNDIWSKEYAPRECLECGNLFDITSRNTKKVFCTRSCSARYNNKMRSKGDSKECERCSAPTKNRFCSQNCSAKSIREEKIQSWLSGEWNGSAKHGLSASVRTYMIELSGNRCTSPTCAVPGGFAEVNPVTGRVPLEVDHIDGNCYNNKKENLMVVCPNCHALTPTYRALNKNSGRAYRRNAGVA